MSVGVCEYEYVSLCVSGNRKEEHIFKNITTDIPFVLFVAVVVLVVDL